MKSVLSLFLASSIFSNIASASISYVDLEHIDPTFITTLTGYTGNIGFINFQGSRNGEDYMISLFYDVDSPLITLAIGEDTDSYATGAYGIYVFNMTHSTMESMYSTSSAGFGELIFHEISDSSSDFINASTMDGGYLYYSDGSPGEANTTTLLDTQNGTISTLAGAGFGAATPPNPENTYMSYRISFTDPVEITGESIHSSGLLSNVVPEPSTALLAAIGAIGLLRRRR